MSQDTAVRSREEDEELEHSTKKVKEDHREGNTSVSYKESLVGEIPGAYEQAFVADYGMETEVHSDDEESDPEAGVIAVNLSGVRKARIRAKWTNALIVKVVGKTVGYQFLISMLMVLWKPSSRLDCIALGKDFFLTRFPLKEEYARVLQGGPWFVGGHYLSLRSWEPNFKPSTVCVSSVAVCIRPPELPIEYYEPSVLQDLGKAIGPVLRIDTHIAAEARGRFTRLCLQVNFDKPLVKL